MKLFIEPTRCINCDKNMQILVILYNWAELYKYQTYSTYVYTVGPVIIQFS